MPQTLSHNLTLHPLKKQLVEFLDSDTKTWQISNTSSTSYLMWFFFQFTGKCQWIWSDVLWTNWAIPLRQLKHKKEKKGKLVYLFFISTLSMFIGLGLFANITDLYMFQAMENGFQVTYLGVKAPTLDS